MVWARIDDQMPDHPKIAAAGPLASWLNVCGICYSARMLTDGFIPKGQVRKLADVENVTELVTALLSAGLWEECNGGYRIHDYLVYNPSRDEVLAQRAENAKRQAEWRERHRKQGSNTDSNAVTNDATNTRPVPTPVPVPVPSPKEEHEGAQSAPAPAKGRKRPEYGHDSEEYRLARLLSARIREYNPSARAPTEAALQGWANDVRLMHEQDGRDHADIRETLLWAFGTTFWPPNLLSMGKFREKYDTITGQRIREQRERQEAARNGQHDRPEPEYMTNTWPPVGAS